VKIMEGGAIVAGPEILSLASARERCRRDLAALPEGLRRLSGFDAPPVEMGPALRALAEEL
jgi:hypothetical protein